MANAKDNISEPPSLAAGSPSASRATSEKFELRKHPGEMTTEKVVDNLQRAPRELALFGQEATTDGKGKDKSESNGASETLSDREECYGHLEGFYEEYFEDIEEVDENLSPDDSMNIHNL